MADEEHILRSHYPGIPFPQLTTCSVVDFILNKVQQNVDKGFTKWLTNAVTGENMKLTDIEPLSRRVASYFVKRGMQKGSSLLYLTSDITRIYAVIVGVWRVGGIMHSSYPEDTQDTLLMRIQESNARWILCDPPSVPKCKEVLAQVDWPVEIIVFGEIEGTTSVNELFDDDGNDCPLKIAGATWDDPIIVICTSGTTGLSKGAILTNQSMLGSCLIKSGIPNTCTRPALLLSRSTQPMGIHFVFNNACCSNWSVMLPQITKQNIFNCVQEYKPIFVVGFSLYLLELAIDPEASKYDRSSIEFVCNGGIPITEDFYTAMHTLPNVKHIFTRYGMAECGPIAITTDLEGNDELKAIENLPKHSVGKLFPNTALKVLDVDTGKSMGPMERGELVVKNSTIGSGYWNRAEETASTFVDGWMKTGDLGYYDEQGFVFVVDRIKDTFKYKNYHISPAEIEAVILKHPAVSDACVFGIVDAGGSIPRAVVVLKEGSIATANEIRDFAHGFLAEYKKLRGGLFLVESLPRGKTGKPSRSAAAKIALPPMTF